MWYSGLSLAMQFALESSSSDDDDDEFILAAALLAHQHCHGGYGRRRRARVARARRRRRRRRSPPPTAPSPHFPPELIPEVARCLTSLQDFYALRAACRAYRALLPLTAANLASQAPLLLVPVEDTESHALFHPRLRRIHGFRFHRTPLAGHDYVFTDLHAFGCRLVIYEIRASEGLHVRGMDNHRNLSIVHLLTGERTCLPTPPEHLSRIVLSGDLVLTWKHFDCSIQYCRLQAADWRVASITKHYALEDLICVNGTLYALITPGYRLAVAKLPENNNSVELVFLGGDLDASTVPLDETPVLYLAECCGDLILVATVELDPRVYHVFQWKFGEAKWGRITSLGGCTLFLADNHFVGCLGPDHAGIRGDSIYITEDTNGDWYEYSLADGTFNQFVAEHPGGRVPSNICSLLWVFPSMC